MDTLKPHALQGLRSGLFFALGLVVTFVVSELLFNLVDLTPVRASMEARLLIFGVLLALFIVALGAAIGGGIGTLSLPLPPAAQRSWWSRAWRGGLTMGPLFSLIMFVFGLALSLFSFYNITEVSSIRFSLMFAFAGAFFGGIYALLLGLLLVRNYGVWHVVFGGLIGFAVGGFALGEGVRRYLLSVRQANLETGSGLLLLIGYVLFGFFGGAALGIAFGYASQKTARRRKAKWWHWAVAAVVALILIVLLRPYLAAAGEMLTPRDANLAFVLDSHSTGTHWSDSTAVSGAADAASDPHQPQLAANASGQVAQVWLQAGAAATTVQWLGGAWDEGEQAAGWAAPVQVSEDGVEAASPQVVLDSSGISHIVWAEGPSILYSQCEGETCSAPVVISEGAACAPADSQSSDPSLTIDGADTLMAVWQTDGGQLLYRSWAAGEAPSGPAACVPTADDAAATQPQVAAAGNNDFGLVYESGDGVYLTRFTGGGWQEPEMVADDGRSPAISIDGENNIHLAWCGDDGVYYGSDAEQERLTDLPCRSRPALLTDSEGTLHLVWYGDEVVDVNGRTQPQTLLYESTRGKGGWSVPAIIAHTGLQTQPALTAVDDSLLLAWESILDGQLAIANAQFTPYSCAAYPLEGIAEIAYEMARDPDYRPADTTIPYCQNQYEQLVFMPNPESSFSDLAPNPNGGFDEFAELARTAEYEVLFSTMWYEADVNDDSPGHVLASAIADLYQDLKANPEKYPRGLTVRILLGNPPELAVKEFSGQLFSVIDDLREAGIDKMIDREIGWRLEVANFDGAMPHSHTKVMVVDGKTILAAGFNMQYEHYPVDHPSGLGQGRQDLGMKVTGPIAQSSQRMFDDLWAGSDQLNCSNLNPVYLVWQATCRYGEAVTDHVPEVLQYYLAGGEADTFSMYRNKDHDEADRIVETSLSAAQHSVDAMHVMFAMDMECDLNLLYDLCDFGEATEYLRGLMDAAENGATVRLIVKPQPTDGIESSVALAIFTEELARRGLQDQVEIRFFEDPVHYKTTLIDDEFLIVGSQNFHYSAFGRNEGLTEYSLGTNDAQAIEDFKRLFEYQWANAERSGGGAAQ